MLEFVSEWANGQFGIVGSIVLFAIGFIALIKGGDWFVDGSVGIAKKFHIPELLIGATVVSIGTTLPEVMVSATSAAKGISQIAYGNAIGSIICNTALIAALTVAIKPALVNKKALVLPVVSFFIVALLYAGVAEFRGYFSRTLGVVLLAMFVVYMVISVIHALKHPEEELEEGGKQLPIGKSIFFLILGAALIAVGANFLVDNGTIIAKALHVPDSVIGLTIIALGTSLPELVTAITSLVKGHGALSLGNIIGANIFNLVLVSGMAITIKPFEVPAEKVIGNGLNASLIVDVPVMLLVMGLLTLPPLFSGKLKRWQGVALLAIYAAFITFQFLG